jgi:hypothetical protein
MKSYYTLGFLINQKFRREISVKKSALDKVVSQDFCCQI